MGIIQRIVNWTVPDRPIRYLDPWVHTGNIRLERGKIVSSQLMHIEDWYKYKDMVKPNITGR